MLVALVADGWDTEDWTVDEDGDLICSLENGFCRIEAYSGWYEVHLEEGWYQQHGEADSPEYAIRLMTAMGAAGEALNTSLDSAR